jgi:hypothetical protein
VVNLFNPSSDLTAIQNILKADATILSLLSLTGKTDVEIVKKIIKRSQWSDLVTNEKRLCIYFKPARQIPNLKFNEEVIEIDCHVPATLDYIAYQVQERAFILLNEQMINKRTIYFNGQLGELPTMSGFFCAGSKYCFNRKI